MTVPEPQPGRWTCAFWEDWTGVFLPRRHNWTDFTVVRLQFENAYDGVYQEFSLGLLGFNVSLTHWAHRPHEDREGNG